MSGSSSREPLTDHAEFDSLISAMANEHDADKAEAIRLQVWEDFGTE
jgi:hypothetical protein